MQSASIADLVPLTCECDDLLFSKDGSCSNDSVLWASTAPDQPPFCHGTIGGGAFRCRKGCARKGDAQRWIGAIVFGRDSAKIHNNLPMQCFVRNNWGREFRYRKGCARKGIRDIGLVRQCSVGTAPESTTSRRPLCAEQVAVMTATQPAAKRLLMPWQSDERRSAQQNLAGTALGSTTELGQRI